MNAKKIQDTLKEVQELIKQHEQGLLADDEFLDKLWDMMYKYGG